MQLRRVDGTGLVLSDLEKISYFLNTHWNQYQGLIKKNSYRSLYLSRHETLLPRSLVITSKSAFILLKTKGGVPKIGEGGEKVIKYAVDFFQCQLVASATSLGKRKKNFRKKISQMEADFIFQTEYASTLGFAVYTCKRKNLQKAILLTPLAEKGDLYNYLTGKSNLELHEREIYQGMLHLASTVKRIHDDGVVYADMKPENVVVEANREFRLIDFSCSWWHQDLTANVFVGSNLYCAPELFSRDKRLISYPIDIYSLGILFWLLLQDGQLPYWINDSYCRNVDRMDYKKARHLWDNWNKIPDNPFFSFLHQMMNPNPMRRPSIEKVIEEIKQLIQSSS